MAAREQHALGFIWDSVTLTRTLEDRKLSSYLALLSEYAGLPTLRRPQPASDAGDGWEAPPHADDPSAGLGVPGGQPL